MNKSTAAMQKNEDGTISLTVTIPFSDVKKAWEEVMDEVVKTAEISGFRKGKAPRNIVEEKVDKVKIREEVLKKLLPVFYMDAIKTHNIRPIINPKIHIEKLDDPNSEAAKESKGWQFTAMTCEAPEINLGKYKENVKKVTAKSKIAVPGKEPEPAKFEDIIKALLDSVTAKIPGVLVESETDKLLSQTLDDVKKLGLTLDQYLSSTGKKADDLRADYRKKAENDIKLEFALQKIAEEEKLTVDDSEIEKAIGEAKTPEEKQNLESNKYLLANILRQQKTLDFLKNL